MTEPGTYRYHLPTGAADVEVVAARLWAAGALGVLEHPDELVAWFPDAAAPVPDGGCWAFEPDRDWQAAWKATIHPVRAGRFVVVPTWRVEEYREQPGDTTVLLDPGRAFGSGHHATTAMCLEALDQLELDGRLVADVGCGSGILSVAAALRGARVVALDVDPDAIAFTAHNAARNEVAVDARLGSIEQLRTPADVVVANLVTDVLLELAPALVARTAGTLVLGGIAGERTGEVAAALHAAGAGLQLQPAEHREGWACLQAQRERVADGTAARRVQVP